MKLHSYLEYVIGSKTAIAYPGKIFTIRGACGNCRRFG